MALQQQQGRTGGERDDRDSRNRAELQQIVEHQSGKQRDTSGACADCEIERDAGENRPAPLSGTIPRHALHENGGYIEEE
jgi:hypothetical protein